MIKIGICDDDSTIIAEVQGYLKRFMKESHINAVISEYPNGVDIISDISHLNLDLLFLDYEMPDINGYELAKTIRKYNSDMKIVFITSYKEYMHLAFGVHAYDYIVKPLSYSNIERTLHDFVKSESNKHPGDILKFNLSINGEIQTFQASEIQYFEFSSRRISIHTTRNSVLLPRGEKISNIANKMEIYGFYSPHKSFVVNLSHVISIKGYNVYLVGGSVIPLSQSRSTQFRQKLNQYLKLKIG